MSLVGRTIEYIGVGDVKREAVIESVNFHEELKKNVYTCISPYGNYFRLTEDEFTVKEATGSV